MISKSPYHLVGKLSLWEFVQNILAAGFGVQSRRNREAAFGTESAFPFLVGGFIFTAGFIGSLALIVALVLA